MLKDAMCTFTEDVSRHARRVASPTESQLPRAHHPKPFLTQGYILHSTPQPKAPLGLSHILQSSCQPACSVLAVLQLPSSIRKPQLSTTWHSKTHAARPPQAIACSTVCTNSRARARTQAQHSPHTGCMRLRTTPEQTALCCVSCKASTVDGLQHSIQSAPKAAHGRMHSPALHCSAGCSTCAVCARPSINTSIAIK